MFQMVSDMMGFNQVLKYLYIKSMFSGAMDVITTKDPNGEMKCTSFHVRFGSLKVLQTQEQCVDIYINNLPTTVKMRLKSGGDAYFDICDIPDEYEDDKESIQSINNQSKGGDEEDFEPIQSIGIAKLIPCNTMNTKNNYNDREILMSNSKKQILIDKKNAESIFVQNIIPKEVFQADPWKLLNDKNTIFLINNVLYDAKIAIPIILSLMIYNEPFCDTKITELINKQGFMKKKAKEIGKVTMTDSQVMKSMKKKTTHISHQGTNKGMQPLYPTSKQLKLLNLKPGHNTITYICKTKDSQLAKVHAEIYLWEDDSKIIISDIDGTITKSDVLGQVMPMIGGEWTHEGVAPLFTKLESHNYKILYLTARALCQSQFTRDYLRKCIQEEKYLPRGPMLMSPDGLFSSFKREVIDKKPDELKINILTEVRALFPTNHCPFYSGFGNRLTDVKAYEHVKIDRSRIFIINTKGEISQPDSGNSKTTYNILYTIVNKIFPIISENQEKDNKEY